jgi:hypothetical protein
MSHGVVPSMTTWFVQGGSALRGNSPPPLEYFVRIVQNWYDIWKKYNLPTPRPFGRWGVGRGTMGNMAICDMGEP